MIFYRYDAVQYARMESDEFVAPVMPYIQLQLSTFNLFKETSKGYWIGYGSIGDRKLRSNARWVSKTSKKRYAYPTRKEALESFILRKKSEIKILKIRLTNSEISLSLALQQKQDIQ
jgi:hypothetical protein